MPAKHPLFTIFAGDTCYHWYQSPFGKLLITGNQTAIATLTFPNKTILADDPATDKDLIRDASPFKDVCKQLDLYFNGKLESFDLPLAPRGTDFQLSVWTELMNIPYGQTTSYGAIARNLKNPKAMRAVGSANGRNPIPIIIPCHRVIGSDGSLTGFGGGLPTKTFLLELENSDQLTLQL